MTSLLPSVTFVTGNANKIREVAIILDGLVDVTCEKVDLPELQGDPLDIAMEKAMAAYRAIGRPCMTEDTSLCFHAFGDLPGPYIRWFAERLGCSGLERLLAGFDDKSAHALCIFALCEGPTKEHCKLFVGRCDGTIVSPRGPEGFGWDPVFQPVGFAETFAEMKPEVKNTISHRFKALQALAAHYKPQ